MEMITLHGLSIMFDVSVRVLRSRVRQLVQAGKLIDGQDYRRDDYVDETHFIWKISPAAFTRVTGLRPVAQPGKAASPTVTQSGNEMKKPATPEPSVGHQASINHEMKSPGMEREMLDFLKDQVCVKDGQIADLTGQTKTLTALNEKLTGAVVHHTEQIKKLLQLTGGKMEPDEPVVHTDNQSTNDGHPRGDRPANHMDNVAAGGEAKAA